MTTKKKPHSELLKCEEKGGTMINGKCSIPKKAQKIEQLKIKIKF